MSALVLLAAGAVQAGENRLWTVELELRGPAAEVRLDCGSDGTTRFLGPFLAGEDRRLTVPVPVRSPLGAEALASLPLPRAELVPAGSGGAVRMLGWSPAQPAEELARRAGALLGRGRRECERAAVRAEAAEVLAVLLAGAVVVGVRRRSSPRAWSSRASPRGPFLRRRSARSSSARRAGTWPCGSGAPRTSSP